MKEIRFFFYARLKENVTKLTCIHLASAGNVVQDDDTGSVWLCTTDQWSALTGCGRVEVGI